MKKGMVLSVGVFIVIIMAIRTVFAADSSDLGKVVVTPYRYGEDIAKSAASVTMITSADIKESNATRVVDILRPLAGVSVRDYYGNGTQAGVDMAGFGEQALLNVLVLVDGRRVNDIDISGVDWTQIPLDQVDHIEVVRGGSGAVLYGDNASSGVINIITKKGAGAPKVSIVTQYGSYAANAQKIALSGGSGHALSYSFSGGRDSTNGYRHNAFNKASDLGGKVSYAFTDLFSMHIDAGSHEATYGIPGALFQTNIDRNGRRFARFGRDHANNKDDYFVIGEELSLMEMGTLSMDASYRRKVTDSYFLTSTNPTRKNKIETFGLMPKYTLNKEMFDHENKLIVGADLTRVFFNSDNYNYSSNNFLNYTNINKTSVAGYAQDELSLTDKLVFVNGYRRELVRVAFNYYDQTGANPSQNTNIHPALEAYNTGLAYNYAKDSTVFLNAGRSFRTPETDEFAYVDSLWQQQLDTTLKPQTSMNYQGGVRHQFCDRLKGSLSLFRMNLRDELYLNYLFDSNGSKNQNYDKTIHQGLETSLELKATDRLSSFINYTYTDAYFKGGQYGSNEIPLASRHKAAVGVKVLLTDKLTWDVTENYTGSSYALNDQANAHHRVSGYAVTDTGLLFTHKDWKTSLGVNNVFNKKYSEYTGYDRWTDSRFYFPSPERNYNVRVEYDF